ncbi:MAG: DNA integrity scanning protein DisA nucleotide-binding domain protein, partial [Bacteroidaceae bacterium]|nr:DNA integrity scanning protein DisA nucleotide-binding domain protein [Bacteroidaceae bacterium]
RAVGLKEFINSGEQIDAAINNSLIQNIFFKNSPLHDGAMIIRGSRIVAAGCILPVSHDSDIPKSLGLRHRAALGISQKTDALAIIVSEETGNISLASNGKFQLKVTPDELETVLTEL